MSDKMRIKIFSCIMLTLFFLCACRTQSVYAKEKITVGTNAEYAPFEYLDSDGNLTGFDYELLEAIAQEENLELEWKDMPFDSLVGSMETGNIQIIAAAIGPTKEREKSVDFSDVYYTGSQSIVSSQKTPLYDFAGLSGKRVAVLEGSQSDFIVSGENTDYGVVENATVVRFKNAASAVMELKNGGVNAVLIDTIMAEIYCRQNDDIVYQKVDGTEEDTVYCIEKGNTELLNTVNKGLKKLKDNGEYDQIYEKFFLGENDTTQVQIADNTGIIGTFKFIFLQDNRWKYYLNGLQVTLLVSIMSVLLGTVIGLMAAMIKLNADRKKKETVLSRIIHIYVDVIRGTPSVLQLMIVYFAVFHSRLGYVAAVVSFGINSGAYVSEVIRAGIMAVDKGQQEAGRSLGLGYKDTMRFIIIPQALKNILPAMGNEFIQLIKETSILGYVGIMDLTKASSYVSSRTYQMFIPLITAGIMYYLIVKILSIFLEKMERRMRQSD